MNAYSAPKYGVRQRLCCDMVCISKNLQNLLSKPSEGYLSRLILK